jgi:hypothetical protein
VAKMVLAPKRKEEAGKKETAKKEEWQKWRNVEMSFPTGAISFGRYGKMSENRNVRNHRVQDQNVWNYNIWKTKTSKVSLDQFGHFCFRKFCPGAEFCSVGQGNNVFSPIELPLLVYIVSPTLRSIGARVNCPLLTSRMTSIWMTK